MTFEGDVNELDNPKRSGSTKLVSSIISSIWNIADRLSYDPDRRDFISSRILNAYGLKDGDFHCTDKAAALMVISSDIPTNAFPSEGIVEEDSQMKPPIIEHTATGSVPTSDIESLFPLYQ
jgi:hypothetical protein